MDRFFSRKLADAIGVGAALQIADLARQVRETMARANARLIAAEQPTLQEQWAEVERKIASGKLDEEALAKPDS